MDRHHHLRHLYNIPTYLSTPALPSIKKASAPMCSCVLMSGLYLRFREADNLDLSLPTLQLISYHTESLTLVPSATLFGFAFRSACIYSCSVHFAAPSHFIRDTVVGFASKRVDCFKRNDQGNRQSYPCSSSMQPSLQRLSTKR